MKNDSVCLLSLKRTFPSAGQKLTNYMVEIILTLLKARRIQIDPNVVNFDIMLSRGRSGDEIKEKRHK